MELFYVHDDVLTPSQHKEMEMFAFQQIQNQRDIIYTLDRCKCFTPLLDVAGKYYDLSTALYYELWQQYNPDWVDPHYDKDEALSHIGIMKTPLCSLVYYHNVSSDIQGGELVIQEESGQKHEIKPITNRLVVFNRGLLHWVKEYEGHRHSILCNPWDRPLSLID